MTASGPHPARSEAPRPAAEQLPRSAAEAVPSQSRSAARPPRIVVGSAPLLVDRDLAAVAASESMPFIWLG